MDCMRALFHYYTQITPLENGGHTIWMDYKQQIPKYACELKNKFTTAYCFFHRNHKEREGYCVSSCQIVILKKGRGKKKILICIIKKRDLTRMVVSSLLNVLVI